MNFNFVNDLHLFKLLLNQNSPTAVSLILIGIRNKKTDFWKTISLSSYRFLQMNSSYVYSLTYNLLK